MENYYVTPPTSPRGLAKVSRKMLLIGGSVLAAIILGFVLLLGSGGKNISTELQHLSLRITALQALLENNVTTSHIKNETLSQIITDLDLTLTSDNNQLTPLMAQAGLPTKFDSNIVASEADPSTATKLNDAYLSSTLDRTFVATLEQKIISLRALIAETYSLSKNTKLRQALVGLNKNLDSAKKRLDGLSL